MISPGRPDLRCGCWAGCAPAFCCCWFRNTARWPRAGSMRATKRRSPASRSARASGLSTSPTISSLPPAPAAPRDCSRRFPVARHRRLAGPRRQRCAGGDELFRHYHDFEEVRSHPDGSDQRHGQGVRDRARAAGRCRPDSVTEAQRRGVFDPMTGSMLHVAGTGELLSPDSCRTGAAIFDGRMRYDLKLDFKRMETVKAEKGYHGPALVCAIYFSPVAGYIPDRPVIKYLAAQRNIEIAFAPIAGPASWCHSAWWCRRRSAMPCWRPPSSSPRPPRRALPKRSDV